MSARLLKLLRVIAFGLVIVGGAGIWYYGFLWDHYRDTLPRSPRPAIGSVYRMNLRGVTVYATRKEHDWMHMLENLLFVLMIPGIAGCILTSEDYWQKMGWRYPVLSHASPSVGPAEPPVSENERDESERFH